MLGNKNATQKNDIKEDMLLKKKIEKKIYAI